jgi:hypothetical protein
MEAVSVAEIPVERKPRSKAGPVITILIILILIAAGWYWWSMQQNKTTPPAPTTTGTNSSVPTRLLSSTPNALEIV